MIDSLWTGLLANFALVALVVSLWTYSQAWLERLAGAQRAIAFGALLGSAAVVMMLLPVPIRPGFMIDLRIAPLAISGFFGGPIAGLVTMAFVATCRAVIGGAGIWAGLVTIAIATAAGIGGYLLRRGRPMKPIELVLLSALMAPIAVSGIFFISAPDLGHVLVSFVLPMGSVVFLATLVCGLGLFQEAKRREIMRENLAYRTMTEALPDCLAAKDMQGRFIAANGATARAYHLESGAELIGKSDFDFFPPETARRFRNDEDVMLKSGGPLPMLQPLEENGATIWWSSLKVPMRDEGGKIVGVLTHARDVTEQRRLEANATESQKHLRYALEQMSDGLAMFDATGRLIFCNEQYQSFFPLSGPMRVPGTHIRDMLRVAVETGEQLGMPQDHTEEWIAKITASLFITGEEEVHLFNGRWLHIRTRPTGDGSSMVVVSDVTRIKDAETALLEMTGQLKLLATTDGLTGLLNRRAFDQALDAEVARSGRTLAPVSLLLIDIDRFKAFNDLYGHPAGDECLRVVSRCLSETVKRPSDIVARYGGEEFVAILPDTDEDGAFHIAEAFRKALKSKALQHAGSEKRLVTASVGIATFGPAERARRASELVTRADEALYGAKEAGRDRVNGWRRRHGVSAAS